MLGFGSFLGQVGFPLPFGTPYFVDSNAIGTFLCFVKLPYISSGFGSISPPRIYTRETTITRASTLVDPSIGTIPADEVVFRTRHIDRRRWGGNFFWERRSPHFANIPFPPPSTSTAFQWVAGAPIGATQINEARKRYYDPFLPFTPPAAVPEIIPNPAPDDYLSDAKNTVNGAAYEPEGYYNTDPEWCFFQVEMKEGQSLVGVNKMYVERAVTYDATAGAYSSPFLDDSIPNSGPSGSEFEITDPWNFQVSAILLRI